MFIIPRTFHFCQFLYTDLRVETIFFFKLSEAILLEYNDGSRGKKNCRALLVCFLKIFLPGSEGSEKLFKSVIAILQWHW